MPLPLPADQWARLETLFVTAIDLAPDACARFIETECATDPGLREQLVSLLRYDTAGQPEVEAALGAGAAWVVDGEALEGHVLGAYRIERELGRGGMSIVYLAARDDGEFRKRVAVKLIKRGMDTDAVVDRLRRERRILATLEHPYMARLLDGGTTPDGRPYIVMEFVEGQPVDQYCQERALDPAARCALIEKVCDAVSYAHRHLVVHRDLKPANILVTSDGTPRLLDFGIARVLEGDPIGDGSPETRSLFQAMTPEYASPEQLTGSSSGTGADVYSLGVILFELLAGSRPYGSDTAQCGREPERASVVASRNGLAMRHARQLEGDLDNILLKAIHLEPGRRYLSVEQMQADLARYRSGLPVAARGDSIVYRAGKFVRRHRFAAIAAMAAILSIFAGMGATLWQARVAQEARDTAEKRRLEAERERTLAEDSARQSAVARQRAESEHAEAESQRARAELQKTAAETERALADRRFEQVRELARKFTTDVDDAIAPLAGSTTARKMLVETGLRYYDSLAADAAGNKGLLEEIARGYDKSGDAQGNPYYANLGDRAGALADYQKALALRSRITDDSPAFLADRILGGVRIGQMLTQKGDIAGAAEVLDGVLKLADAAPVSNDYALRDSLARAWTALGDLKNQNGTYAAAISCYEKVLAVAEAQASVGRNPDSERIGVSLAHTKLGEVYARMEKGTEALSHLRPALAIDSDISARQPNSIPRMRKLYFDYVFMSWVYRSAVGQTLGTPEQAREVVDKAAAIADRMAAADTNNTAIFKDVATAQNNYAIWLRIQKDYQASLEHFQMASDAVDRYTAGRPHTLEFDDMKLESAEYLGRTLVDLGRPDDALAHLATARDFLTGLEKQNPGMPHLERRRAEIDASAGSAYGARKEWSKAIDSYQEALAIALKQSADQANGEMRNVVPLYQSNLAEVYAGNGQIDQARSLMRAAIDTLLTTESGRPLAPDELKVRTDAEAKLAVWR